MAEHNIRHALPQGVQLPRPPVNNRLPRAGPGGELGVEPTREWVRRRLARPRRRPRTRRCSTDLWRSTRRPCRRSRRHPWPCLRPPGSMSSPPRRSHDVADCADTTFYLLQPFEHATVAGCADCLLGSRFVVSSSWCSSGRIRQTSLSGSPRRRGPAGVECSEVGHRRRP